ncbi:MAG: hypothetical protein U1G07_24590 [Verrucomicrobiota bacterium]
MELGRGGGAQARRTPVGEQNKVPGLQAGGGRVGEREGRRRKVDDLCEPGLRVEASWGGSGFIGLRHLWAESIPLMMGINQRPHLSADEKLIPPMNHGGKKLLMSMGFLLEGDAPSSGEVR